MYKVIEQRQVNECADSYREAFHDRVGKEPKIDNLDRAGFEFLIKQIGYEETLDAIEHYFEMKDEWFITQAYSVKCLKDNINKVIMSLAQREELENANKNIQIMCESERLFYYSLECTQIKGKYNTLHDVRDKLGLNKDGSDDWMIQPPYKLSDVEFEKWKKLNPKKVRPFNLFSIKIAKNNESLLEQYKKSVKMAGTPSTLEKERK